MWPNSMGRRCFCVIALTAGIVRPNQGARMDLSQFIEPSGPGVLNEHQSKQLLQQYGIPVVQERLAADAEQAVKDACGIGFPVVVKAMGALLLHKTEMGLVRLHLGDEPAVRQAVEDIQRKAGDKLEGLLIQPQITGQRELMAGMFRDPQFGPVVTFGLGGVLAEALDDVAMAVAPLTEADAREMIDHVRAKKILAPFRGEEAVEVPKVVDTLLGLSRLAADHPEIAEVDINPLRVTPDGALLAVDALVVVTPPQPVAEYPVPVAPGAIGRLFTPRAIAFVGASSQLGKWGQMLTANTLGGGYQGEVYLVNPKGGTMLGRPVYPTLGQIPGPVDLAVVTVPAAKVLDLLPQCHNKGIQYMVLITSGFGETGPAGRQLEQELKAAARSVGVLILGPNTMGIANPHIRLYCTGSTVTPLPGGTAMVSQSGNMGAQLLAFAEQQGIGIRGFCGSGNEAMITMEDYLEAFEVDELTQTVILYVESLKNSRRFLSAARRVTHRKPVVLLKGGQTDSGKKAAASHTGALMSDTRVFNSMCRQAGITKVEQPMELLDLAAAFSSLPLPRGPRTAIMTLGGGWGVVTADLCQAHQLEVPDLDPPVIKALDSLLPPYWSRSNPVDLVGERDLELPVKSLEILMAWDGCDAVINLGILGRRLFLKRLSESVLRSDPQADSAFLEQAQTILGEFETRYIGKITELMEKHRKPVIGVHLLTDGKEKTIYPVPGSPYSGVFYSTPERAVKALSRMAAYRRYTERP
jgi:acyl-CoA synthetase (NDP forming)